MMRHARQCLDEIVDLYQGGTHENAPELLERVVDLYFLTLDQQTPEERDTFGDVMQRMAFTADTLTRARFSERIAKAELAPAELVRRLAREEICVARPVLQYSLSLREGDLVAITTELDQDHLMATAHRRELTRPVTDVLVARGETPVLIAVARNVGAEISPESLARLNGLAGEEVDLRRALSIRRDTAPGPMSRLKRLTDTDFWHQLAESLLMSYEEVVEAAPAEPDAAAGAKAPGGKEQAKPEPPAEQPHRPLSPLAEKHLVEAARAGKVPEAVQCFSKIARLDEGMIEHCLFEAHLPALMVLCKAHRLTPSTFTALLQLRENNTETPIEDTVGLLRRYESMSPDTAQRVIRFADKTRSPARKKPDIRQSPV